MPTDSFSLADGAYRPDPESEITLLLDGFFAHLAAGLALSPATVELIKARHSALEAGDRYLVTDEPSRHNLRLTLALVAAHEVLRSSVPRDELLAAIEVAFVEPFAEDVRAGTRAMLDAAPDPFTAMVEMSKNREEHAFGPTFTFDRTADDDRRYLLDVRKCFYHDVLASHGVAELTPAMCAFDASWIDAIDEERDGFRFDRPTTIGFGGDHCPFHFRRTR